MSTLAAITIGQSPRTDLIPEMLPFIGEHVRMIEGGALDALSKRQIAEMAPEPGDYVLVTRLRDGTSVKIAERHIVPLMQTQIDRAVKDGADVVALVCTGEFPEFRCPKPLIRPQLVLGNAVRAVAGGLSLGVVLPDSNQIPQARKRWADAAQRVEVVAASPYIDSEAEIQKAAEELAKKRCDLVALDCIGFTSEHKRHLRDALKTPVILARTVLARMLGEMMGS